MAETAGVEPAQPLRVITGFKPDKRANARLRKWRRADRSKAMLLRAPVG